MERKERPYICSACGHKENIVTNHEGSFLHYCDKCSWKRDFAGKDKSYSIPQLGNHTYRKFHYFNSSVNEYGTNKNIMKYNIKNILKLKECMTMEQKKKLLLTLKKIQEEYTGNIGGETDIANADCLVSEDDMQTRNVIAKTFETRGDFDSYINQYRGIQITPKEQQSIIGYKSAKPTAQDKFFIKYETTDNFGNNNTTIIKKLREGQQFCWTAISKNEASNAETEPDEQVPEDNKNPETNPEKSEFTVNDTIRIIKTITFVNDIDGATILGDLLRKLDI